MSEKMTWADAWDVILRWSTVFSAFIPLLFIPLGEGNSIVVGILAIPLFLIWLFKKGWLIFTWLVGAAFLFSGLFGLLFFFEYNSKPTPPWLEPKSWALAVFVCYTVAGAAAFGCFLRMKRVANQQKKPS